MKSCRAGRRRITRHSNCSGLAMIVCNITTFGATVEKTVSAAEANRKFSRLLGAVREGGSFIITSHGRPVARLSRVEPDEEARSKARAALFKRLRKQPVTNVGKWTREELYER